MKFKVTDSSYFSGFITIVLGTKYFIKNFYGTKMEIWGKSSPYLGAVKVNLKISKQREEKRKV